jgi:hypothetical protein
MKVLIYQVYVPTNHQGDPVDSPKPRIVKESVDSFTKYAKKHGIDYLFEDTPTFKKNQIPKDKDGRMRFYWSMALCRDELLKYDYVIHVDTDIIAQENASDIRPHLKGDFCAVRELIDYLGRWHKPLQALRRAWEYHGKAKFYGYDQYQYFNSGVWASSAKARLVIRENWRKWAFRKWEERTPKRFPFKERSPFEGDQDILNAIVHTSDLEFHSLTWNWNGLSDALKNIEQADFIHYCAKAGKFLFKHPEYLEKTPFTPLELEELEAVAKQNTQTI